MFLSPGLKVTAQNIGDDAVDPSDDGTSISMGASGPVRQTTFADGSIEVIANGHNFVFDPGSEENPPPPYVGNGTGIWVTGGYSFGWTPEGVLIPLTGNGREFELIDALI